MKDSWNSIFYPVSFVKSSTAAPEPTTTTTTTARPELVSNELPILQEKRELEKIQREEEDKSAKFDPLDYYLVLNGNREERKGYYNAY